MHYEADLLAYATTALKSLKHFRLVGEAIEKVPVLSFTIRRFTRMILERCSITKGLPFGVGITVRSSWLLPSACFNRLSLAFYNTRTEIDRCMEALQKAVYLLG